jgi:hypothetical protein
VRELSLGVGSKPVYLVFSELLAAIATPEIVERWLCFWFDFVH